MNKLTAFALAFGFTVLAAYGPPALAEDRLKSSAACAISKNFDLPGACAVDLDPLKKALALSYGLPSAVSVGPENPNFEGNSRCVAGNNVLRITSITSGTQTERPMDALDHRFAYPNC